MPLTQRAHRSPQIQAHERALQVARRGAHIYAKYLLFGLRSPARPQFKSEVDGIDSKEEKDLVRGFDKETADAVLDFRFSLIDYQDRRRWDDFLDAVSRGFGPLMDWEERDHEVLDEWPDDDYIHEYSAGHGFQEIFDDA